MNCGYSLTGLTGSRCPECGVRFSLREMLADEPPAVLRSRPNWIDPPDHHMKRREAALTGEERPLPDFGFVCALCDQPLAGAVENRCPHCGDPFDLAEFIGNRDWTAVSRYASHFTSGAIRAVLYDEVIPYLADVTRLQEFHVAESCVRVPREFFFDALFALQQALEPPAEFAREPWTCPACRKKVPKGFEICWNCGKSHPLAEGLAGER
jgi:predicted amidophosphoribosyltransferase